MQRIGFNYELYELLIAGGDAYNPILPSCPPQGRKREAEENVPPPGVRPVEKKLKLRNTPY